MSSTLQGQSDDDSSLSWDDSEEEEQADNSAAWSAMNLPEMDDATRQLIIDSIKANAASDEEEDEEELLQMLTQPSMSEETTALLQEASSASGAAAEASTAAAGVELPDATDATHLLQADGDSLAQQDSEATLDMHDLKAESTKSPALRLPLKKIDAESLEDYDQWDQNYWKEKEPEAVAATLAAAQIWSRIIRTPRKRGKHIILDVCAPLNHETNADAVDTAHGHLVRQVVATTDKRTWLGPGGYRLARKSRWGDLWPKFYQDNALTHKL